MTDNDPGKVSFQDKVRGNMIAQTIIGFFARNIMGCLWLLIGLSFVIFFLVILGQFYEEYVRPVFVR
jgi:hypothetical protein